MNDRAANNPTVNRRTYLKIAAPVAIGLTGLRLGTAPTSAASQVTQYQGIGQSYVENTDFYGNSLRPQRFTNRPAQGYVEDPITWGGQTETNPFSLGVSIGDSQNNGDLNVQSAYGTSTPDTNRPVLLQYWDLRYNPQNGDLVGELTDTHEAEGAVLNFLYMLRQIAPPETEVPVEDAYPQEIAVRARMRGRVTRDEMNIRVRGHCPSGSVTRFVSQVSCQRVR